MKKPLFILAAVLATAGLPKISAASAWNARLRATYLQTVDKSDAFSALGLNFAKDAVKVSDRLIPEIDVGYDLTPNWSAEVVLTIPQKHTVTLQGAGRLGTFKHLPPTFLMQYRPTMAGNFHPYFAAGINVTLIFDANLAVAGVPLGLDSSSVGLAGQVGGDWKINDSWSFNVDLKKAAISTPVKAGGTTLTEARLDPWMYSIGLRRQF
ncbi:MAG: outer membrane protein precursor [Verrucomicrobiota bacterium]|jgi:outer membrane protein